MPNPSTSSETTTFVLSGVSTLDPLLNVQYQKWSTGATLDVELTYSFPWSDGGSPFWQSDYSSAAEPDAAVHFALDSIQQSAVVRALQSWAAVAAITFVEVAESENNVGDFRFAFSSAVGEGWGYCYYPNDYWASSADVWINPSVADDTDWGSGSHNELALIHEIGHGLGLKHPGNYDVSGSEASPFLPADLDFRYNTVMSYNDKNYWFLYSGQNHYTGVKPSTPMVYDIAAIQYLYGVNETYHTGADTYSFDPASPFFSTLWDAGGNDTLDVSNFSTACDIDLIPGHYSSLRYSSIGTIDNLYDGTHNLGIALGTIIENAFGGSNSDIIIGNNAGNMLVGGGGNDTLIGGAGNDTLDGADGSDTAEFSGNYAEYDISYDPITSRYTVRDNIAYRDGTDSVFSVEHFVFADMSILAVDTGEEFAINGVSMSAYSKAGYDGLGYTNLITNAVDSGANYVGLGSISIINLDTGVVGEFIKGVAAGYNLTASLESVEDAVLQAEAVGLNVFLKPQITVFNPSSGTYTGSEYGNLLDASLVMAHPEAFFAGYKNYIVQWAEVAERTHVSLFSIGNEMLAVTKPEYTAYWEDIIASVREVYNGKLTYAAFSDVTRLSNNEVGQIQFWDKLDYVGVDVYPDFPTGMATPTVAQLDAEWASQGWMGYLADIAAITEKQIIFTETGCSSFAGAANRSLSTDALIGQPETQRDDATQAHWYESFLNTWSGAERPEWLSGTFFWNNDPPHDAGFYDVTGYTFYGKEASVLVTSVYGGANYLAVNQNSFIGSSFDDRIMLYGDARSLNRADAVHDPAVIRSQTFRSTVTIYLNGTIINGVTPTVHFFINGVDMGAQQLSDIPSSWIDPTGLVSSDVVPFSFQVDSMMIKQIKVAIDSPVIAGSQVYIDRVEINGVSLANTEVTYQPVSGDAITYLLPDYSLNNGGYVSIDPTPYNNTLDEQPGTAAHPFSVNGGGGFDTLYLLGSPDQYVIQSDSAGITYISEHAGLNQNAVLNNVSAITFADGSQFMSGHWSTTEGAADVPVYNDIVLNFSEAIQQGLGTIALHSGSSSDDIVEYYDVATSKALLFSGSALSINPTADLTYNTHYVVTLDEGSVRNLAGHAVGTGIEYDFTTEPQPIEEHTLSGSITFWKTNAAIHDVTTTMSSVPDFSGAEALQFRNVQLHADGSHTVEIWAISEHEIASLQLAFNFSAGSVATWQQASGLPSGWTVVSNTQTSGHFIFGGMGTTAIAAGSLHLGTLTLTEPADPDHFELLLSSGWLGNTMLSSVGIASDSISPDMDGLYQHCGMFHDTYALTIDTTILTSERSAVTAEDALAALKMAVGLNPNAAGAAVSSYQYLAADVNHDGKIRATDALNILKMAVGLETAPHDEWIFVPESVGSETMTRNHVDWSEAPIAVDLSQNTELNLVGVVKGDVDGSWGAVG